MSRAGDARADSVAAALEQVGDRWTFLVLRESFFGVRRFADFQRNLDVARNILSDRLGKLVDHGILRRHRYSERPPREEYRLTDKGRDLYGIVVALMRWGDRWVMDEPPLTLTHAADGGTVTQVLRCTSCGGELGVRDIAYHQAHGRGEGAVGDPADAPARERASGGGGSDTSASTSASASTD
ncbi:putative Transcriptional regulator [Streptomyces albus]|uniref:Putative Transcriptional regulator n=1 Tax=Streptomyces albus (strain ATCC 21838 / DSM 41398 / FERM P-419 / JCM 4703 / NBRC 107858) TaxID=1081613 RepID=A0A0B5EKQ9_STRA4|nr:putative Transcriptional regulator [Streptomyces albus]AOU77169.1 putative Transcriptional regulator [Streptomyces albus]AYN32947.1 transcriptional regulator [Streptomyces albus]